MPTEDAYRDDLAYIHDAGHGDLATAAARRLIDELARAGLTRGAVVDLGCGSGVFAAVLVDAGYHVVGLDTSPAMIALARARVPQADFRVGSFVSAELPECVAVTAIGEVFSYAFDSANDASTRASLFRRIHEALVPGGLLLFDVADPERAPAGDTRRTHATGDDWAVLAETSRDDIAGVLRRRITTFRRAGILYRRDVEVHRLALLDPASVLESLRVAGFEPSRISSYGSTPFPPGLAGFLAKSAPAPARPDP